MDANVGGTQRHEHNVVGLGITVYVRISLREAEQTVDLQEQDHFIEYFHLLKLRVRVGPKVEVVGQNYHGEREHDPELY